MVCMMCFDLLKLIRSLKPIRHLNKKWAFHTDITHSLRQLLHPNGILTDFWDALIIISLGTLQKILG